MGQKRISERKVIEYTAGLVVLAGIVRFFAYSTGNVLFHLAFVPFLIYRLLAVVKSRKDDHSSIKLYRGIVMVLMIITIALNGAGWQEADFLLIFLLMVDYLLVINKRF
ncbi:MAG: hypothetical protein RBR30_13140 [Tenuifilaceae bacterium]|nr:hypothetical protein [Tenuifilaceae bacterium]